MGVRRVLLAGIRSAGSLSVNLVVDNFRLSRGAFIASLKSCFPGWLAATLFIGTLLGHGPTLQYLIVKIVDNPGLNPYAAISGDGVSTTVQFADWILEAYFWPYLLITAIVVGAVLRIDRARKAFVYATVLFGLLLTAADLIYALIADDVGLTRQYLLENIASNLVGGVVLSACLVLFLRALYVLAGFVNGEVHVAIVTAFATAVLYVLAQVMTFQFYNFVFASPKSEFQARFNPPLHSLIVVKNKTKEYKKENTILGPIEFELQTGADVNVQTTSEDLIIDISDPSQERRFLFDVSLFLNCSSFQEARSIDEALGESVLTTVESISFPAPGEEKPSVTWISMSGAALGRSWLEVSASDCPINFSLSAQRTGEATAETYNFGTFICPKSFIQIGGDLSRQNIQISRTAGLHKVTFFERSLINVVLDGSEVPIELVPPIQGASSDDLDLPKCRAVEDFTELNEPLQAVNALFVVTPKDQSKDLFPKGPDRPIVTVSGVVGNLGLAELSSYELSQLFRGPQLSEVNVYSSTRSEISLNRSNVAPPSEAPLLVRGDTRVFFDSMGGLVVNGRSDFVIAGGRALSTSRWTQLDAGVQIAILSPFLTGLAYLIWLLVKILGENRRLHYRSR